MVAVPLFWQEKYKREASKNWDKFYKRNSNRFFKDRHWLQREFEEVDQLDSSKTLLEVGCGVGNLVFPIQERTGCAIIAADFAETAISVLLEDKRYKGDKIRAIVHDFTCGHLSASADLATMIFVLSAVPPERHVMFLQNVARSCGRILFRDYAVGDAAQLRFAESSKISNVLFVRQDGTLSFFFDIEYIERIASEAGMQVYGARYIETETVNAKENLHIARRFLQCTLRMSE